MIFYHGTNTIALKMIMESNEIKPLKYTNKPNICCTTTTMQNDLIYLSTEKFIANFYTPRNGKVKINDEYVYSAILEIELPYDDNSFRPDEDYMDDIMMYLDYEPYKTLVSKDDYKKYSYKAIYSENIKPEDIDFKLLLSENYELGIKILSGINPELSIALGCVGYLKAIPLDFVKSVEITDIFSTKITNLTENNLNEAINKLNINLLDEFDCLKI